MRSLLTIILILSSGLLFGQDLEKQKAVIDAEVERISHRSKLTTVSFSIQALKKVLHYISYRYVESPGGYVKIERQFSQKNDTIRQAFYLKDGSLIYVTEKITTYFTDNGKTDSIIWSGDFYFSKEKLIDHVTLGHGKSEIDTWNPEQEILTALSESKRDIARYKKNKKGS
jgi:hypothetical protein